MLGSKKLNAVPRFEDSRRLTGPNLFFNHCGAVLEAVGPAAHDAAAHRLWEHNVRSMCALLGWPVNDIVVRCHNGGASLAFSAAADQLFCATEVNEWAWINASAAHYPVPAHSTEAIGDEQAVIVLDQASAAPGLWAQSALEQRPALMDILAYANAKSLNFLQDDDALSLGSGAGGQTWPIDALPDTEVLNGLSLFDVPIALVTGSNGKTTTVRLIAALAKASGFHCGYNCTDGVVVDGESVVAGDYSGPAGARQVLRDKRVQMAILETARGGILRRGLAAGQACAAIVTNVSADHFGEYGIDSLTDLADAKLTVAQALRPDGILIINADDETLLARAKARIKNKNIALFSLHHHHPELQKIRAENGATCAIENDRLVLCQHGRCDDLGSVLSMPLTVGGSALYNMANIAGAVLCAAVLGLPVQNMAKVVATFGSNRRDNPGRLERWNLSGLTVLLDYAHNPEGLSGLMKVATQLRGRGRIGVLLGQAGNRSDEAIRELAQMAASFAPDYIVLKDIDGFLRGRLEGEVPTLLWRELLNRHIKDEQIETVLPEFDAAQRTVELARIGDVVVLPVHNATARVAVENWLDLLATQHWTPGMVLPKIEI